MAYRIICKGRVQGVFYRASTQEKALALGVKGWVRNEPDGSVMIHAEQGEVDELIEWCRVEPPHARVESVSWKKVEDEGATEFRIER